MSQRSPYHTIRLTAEEPEPLNLELPDVIVAKPGHEPLRGHLYEPEDALARFGLNNWERTVLAEELSADEVVAWLRNPARKEWAFCVPYEIHGETKPLYPDFLIIRKGTGTYIVDVLEPHNAAFVDAVPKAVGLARFAAKHGHRFGRIQFIVLERDTTRRLEFNDESTRSAMLGVKTAEHFHTVLEQWSS